MTLKAQIELIVAADEPALFFRSVDEAQSYLEAIDVRNGIYWGAWDRRGQPHSVCATGDIVHLTPLTDEPEQPDHLIEVLVSFLRSIGQPAVASDGLSRLLAQCEPYAQ